VQTTPSPPRPVQREEPNTPVLGLAAQPVAPAKPAAAKPAPAAAKPAAAKPAEAKPSPSPVARPKPAPEAAATSGAQSKATVGLPASDPYGPGSALPLADGSAPLPEYTIKGNATSKLFHTPSSPYYGRTIAEVWFRSEDDAERAGFTRWVRKSKVNPSG